jgi:hypothetical protein
VEKIKIQAAGAGSFFFANFTGSCIEKELQSRISAGISGKLGSETGVLLKSSSIHTICVKLILEK